MFWFALYQFVTENTTSGLLMLCFLCVYVYGTTRSRPRNES